MEEITIKLNTEKAEKLSIAIYNIFINNFFDFSEALKDLYNFDDLLKLNHLMIDLKSLIDIELTRDL